AKVVYSTIAEAHPGLRDVSVVGFVVLSKGDTLLEIDDPRANRVFPLDDKLVEALTGEKYLFNPRKYAPLDRNRMKAVQEALLRRHVDPEERLVGNYRIVEELSGGEGYEAFEAQHVNISGRRARLKKYHIPAVQSQRHLQESVQQFQQDMEALARVEIHPHIVRAYDFFKDPDVDDTYYLALELVDGKSLHEMIDEGTELTVAESVAYLAPVADALAFCHDQGIIHRNLTPHSVYVQKGRHVKLGDFDFARVPAIGRTITRTGEPLVVNKYVAPEQLDNPREAGALADLYSLGAVWYDLLLRRPESEAVRLSLVARSELPEMARQLMQQLLSPDPARRPQSAQEVREWFELLAAEDEAI
ncbi:MAG: serine/threonine-protein kinase, partial [Chloroflexota bacterium]